jgi:hypothetical protein
MLNIEKLDRLLNSILEYNNIDLKKEIIINDRLTLGFCIGNKWVLTINRKNIFKYPKIPDLHSVKCYKSNKKKFKLSEDEVIKIFYTLELINEELILLTI